VQIYLVIKRITDIGLSLCALILLFPLLFIIAIIIRVDSKGSVLFKQKRIGLHKEEFYIIKFRTMSIETPKDVPTHMLQKPDEYITRVGRFLRKSSLDELPQLINILKGEMSIVGPRPALWNQYDLVTERDTYGVNDIVPGLTGWAQVNGRDELSIKSKAELDGYYVKNMSIILDIKVLFLTLFKTLFAKGVIEGMHCSKTTCDKK
jgi:O-antigen biosynthesis protein WbqP